MQHWKDLQAGEVYRTSEERAEELRYQQECAEDAARQRQEEDIRMAMVKRGEQIVNCRRCGSVIVGGSCYLNGHPVS